MATTFILPLLITFDDIKVRASEVIQISGFTQGQQDATLQFVHDWLYLNADNVTPGDSQNIQYPGMVRQLQIVIGAWHAAFIIDTPAGTGSLSGVSIDAFSVSNTMAKNNSTATDLLNANQFGTEVYEILSQRPETRLMI